MIDVKVDLSKITNDLQNLQNALGDLSPALNAIGEQLVESTKRRIETGTQPDGGKMEANAPGTIKKKGHDRPLIDSGTLLNSIFHQVHGNTLVIGTPMEYAALQQFGGAIEHAARSQKAHFKVNMKTGKSKFATKEKANLEQWLTIGAHTTQIPARPFLGLSTEDEDVIMQTIQAALKNAI